MKILMINSFYYMRGGSERCFFDLSAMLTNLGHRVIPFCMEHPQNLPSEYDKYFVSQIDYPTALRQKGIGSKLNVLERAFYSREARQKLEQLIQDEQPDLVHIHGFIHEMSTSILPVLKAAGLPVIQTLHDFKLRCPNTSFITNGEVCEQCKGHRYYNVVRRRCKRGSLSASLLAGLEMYFHEIFGLYEPNIDLFISPSLFLQKKMKEHGVKKPIVAIPNFVNLEAFQPCYEPEAYFTFVGRLAPGKGIRTVLSAMQYVEPTHHLYIAGAGELEAELKQFAQDKNLQNVTFLGHLGTPELNSLMQKSLFSIAASELYENYPMSVIEAFASGTAVIGSNLGGIAELVKDNWNGLLFEPGNAADLAQKINMLAGNRALAIEMGKRGRQQVESVNTPEAHLKATLKVYERFVGERAKSSVSRHPLESSVPA